MEQIQILGHLVRKVWQVILRLPPVSRPLSTNHTTKADTPTQPRAHATNSVCWRKLR